VSDDPLSPRQWYLSALGVPEAWHVTRGEGVVVAVVDNGFDVDHPDLAGQLWWNEDEAEDGDDEDHNGYVDDLHGWDFLDGVPDVGLDPPRLEDRLRSHGTAAAGIIAAAADDGFGVAGCCPECRLMLLTARDFDEARTVVPRLAEAIAYAIDNGARVVSISDGVLPADLAPDESSA